MKFVFDQHKLNLHNLHNPLKFRKMTKKREKTDPTMNFGLNLCIFYHS